jgi:hypothetical protein
VLSGGMWPCSDDRGGALAVERPLGAGRGVGSTALTVDPRPGGTDARPRGPALQVFLLCFIQISNYVAVSSVKLDPKERDNYC